MVKFRVDRIEERPDGDVACDAFVLKGEAPEEAVIGHFTVIIRAADVLALALGQVGQRVQAYKDLIGSDPRIQGVTDSEAAVSQMEADVNFPLKVTI